MSEHAFVPDAGDLILIQDALADKCRVLRSLIKGVGSRMPTYADDLLAKYDALEARVSEAMPAVKSTATKG